jgi:arginase
MTEQLTENGPAALPQVAILGVPMDLGAARRGVDMGPSALRLARLEPAIRQLGYDTVDLGNVPVSVVETLTGEAPSFAAAIASACHTAFQMLTGLRSTQLPLTLGGDHSISMATVAAALRGPLQCGGVLWLDAHTDLNTPETSPSGNIHGMPLAHLLGYGSPELQEIWGGGAVLRPEQLVYVGLRSVDQTERELINDLGIRAYTMTDIDRLGIARVAAEAAEYLGDAGRWHVSLDADILDPSLAPGVGTPVRGGITYREAHLLMELLADSGKVASIDLVEVNPILDDRNRTAQTLVGLTSSLLGKRIL